MLQKDLWYRRTKSFTVEDVVKSHHKPSQFQIELADCINTICKKNNNQSSVLEIGSEMGITSTLLSDNIERTLLDYNPEAIALSKKAYEKLNIKAKFIVSDIFNNSVNCRYDIVFSAGLIEHYKYYARVKIIQESVRLLKKGGLLILAFPNHYSMPYRTAYLVRNYLFLGYKWRYPKEYKLYDLGDEINEAGCRLIKRYSLSHDSLLRWWDFFIPIKKYFLKRDKKKPYEGYLTVVEITKNS